MSIQYTFFSVCVLVTLASRISGQTCSFWDISTGCWISQRHSIHSEPFLSIVIFTQHFQTLCMWVILQQYCCCSCFCLLLLLLFLLFVVAVAVLVVCCCYCNSPLLVDWGLTRVICVPLATTSRALGARSVTSAQPGPTQTKKELSSARTAQLEHLASKRMISFSHGVCLQCNIQTQVWLVRFFMSSRRLLQICQCKQIYCYWITHAANIIF